MQQPDPKWGLVSTIKAEAAEILEFAAYHIEAGAHRLFLYLDAPCPAAMVHLEAHPKIRVKLCDQAYWDQNHPYRPVKHQVRQTLNATRAYLRQSGDLDWLIHMDVDEFLAGPAPVSAALGALDASVYAARLRPVEALADSDGAFKRFIGDRIDRDLLSAALYPEFGPFLKSGFVSHVQGKTFLRTGQPGLEVTIHGARTADGSRLTACDLPALDLCHFHADDWDSWLRHFRYRLAKGSYRAELGPLRPKDRGGVTMHQLLTVLHTSEGEAGLRRFFQEVCTARPKLLEQLRGTKALVHYDLKRSALRRKHFPDFG